ncbi:MAG: hypothetical protein ACRD1C_03835 [Terriglobales bacterium]
MADQHKGKGMLVVIGVDKPRPGAPGAGPDLSTPVMRRNHAADVEAAFTGRPQPHGTFDAEHDGGRVSAETAGYMELEGAEKSGECDLVNVPGGVSGERGCCNLFEPRPGATEFECGQCQHFQGAQPAQEAVNA